ncbi:hypothetical protein V6N13_051595 [Hibiscus sabdariffa]
MSFAANPLEPTAGNGLAYPECRPPDNASSIPDSAIRERSVSPLRMGDGRTMKKGRTEGFFPPGNTEMHVVDVSVESLAKVSPSDADTVIVDVGTNSATFNESVRDSHASKDVCKANTSGVGQMHSNAQVQESADNSHDDVISESSLFGPWMVVADRGRRGGTVRSGGPTNANPSLGSRFESLLVDDIGEGKDHDGSQKIIVRKDDTFVPEGDNAERASKDMVGAVRIIEHDTGLKMGDHKAVSVIEQESHDTSKSTGVGQRKRTTLGKGIVDVSRSKVLLRRNPGGRNADSIPITDFMNRLSSDLDMIQTHDGSSGSRAGGHLQDHEAMLQSSDEEDSYRFDSPEVLPEGAVFEDD